MLTAKEVRDEATFQQTLNKSSSTPVKLHLMAYDQKGAIVPTSLHKPTNNTDLDNLAKGFVCLRDQHLQEQTQ